MIIQFLLVPGIVLAVLVSLRSRSSLRGQARRKILALLTVVAGVLSVVFPSLLQMVADWVGVTRGTDLLLYLLAVVIIYLVGSTSVRFREQEARMVRLSREMALAETEGRLRTLSVARAVEQTVEHAVDAAMDHVGEQHVLRQSSATSPSPVGI